MGGKKDAAVGRKAQSGLRQRARKKARTARKGWRWGTDKPVIGKPQREHVVPHRAGWALTAEPERSLI